MSETLFTAFIDDEGKPTKTTEDERKEEDEIKSNNLGQELLLKNRTFSFSLRELNDNNPIGSKTETLSPWKVFYAILPLLIIPNAPKDRLEEARMKSIDFLRKRQLKTGGFSGFPNDNVSLVTVIGAICGIMTIGKEEAYEIINRKALYDSIMALKMSDGSFRVSLGEENDIRSTFAALFICYYIDMLTPELIENVLEFTLSCRCYDGGFSPKPGMESHGGYTFCGVMILKLLNKLELLDFNKTIRWLSARQMEFAGGFNGRTNKLVDSCYTWWVGAPMRVISDYLKIPPFWDTESLTIYVLRVSQSIFGGFCDHPPSKRDQFHTVYSLSGLAIAGEREKYGFPIVDPFSGVPLELAEKMRNYFINHK